VAELNGWTVDTLYKHLSSLIEAHSKVDDERFAAIKELLEVKEERDVERFKTQSEATKTALSNADRAVNKAETAAEKRFEGVNEFRQSLNDYQQTLMPRKEAEMSMGQLKEDIRLLQEINIRKAGQGQGIHLGWVIITGAIFVVGSLLALAAYLLNNIK